MPVKRQTKTPPPTRQTGKTRTTEQPEGGEEKGGMSKADAFDNAKAQGAVDNGKYDAVISELVLQDADEKGQSVRIKYKIATDGDFVNQELAQFYKCFEADESPGKGLAFLKKDLAILGYDDVKFNELEQVFEEIVEKRMGVVITVKQNGQFTNCYLGGLCEDSTVVEEFLEKYPY